RASPISAMGDVAIVAEVLRHQLVPEVADLEDAASTATGKGITRQTWRDDIERIRRVAAMALRIGQQRNQLREPDDRVGKAVGENNRERLRSAAALVNEVKLRAVVQRHAKLMKAIQRSLLLPPVVRVAPIVGELPHVVETDAVLPVAIA